MLLYTDVLPAVNQVEVHPYFQQKDLVKYFGAR
jgi:diketogulonate reductase-like aldo/keto reductase